MPRIPTVQVMVEGRLTIINADDPRASAEVTPPEITRESVADMDGGELTELLEAHGVEDVPHRLTDRREMLTRIMFADL